MSLYTFSTISVFTFGLFLIGESKFPAGTCKRDSSDYSACLKRALDEAWPRFVKGLPEYDFPSLDPLVFEHATATLNLSEIRGKIIATNLTTIGLSKARFSDIRTHLLDDVFSLEIDVNIPWLYVEGIVNVNSILNVFGISGKGYFNETLEDVRGTWYMIGHVINNTLIIEHFRVTPSIEKFRIYFDNLLEQSKEINDLVVNFVNQYWPTLYRVVLPILADIYDPWLVEFPNKLFSKFPFSEIFP